MSSPEAVPKPFQFRLQSIFVATAAIAVALGLLRWLGPMYLSLVVQFTAVIAVLVTSRGTAWRGVVILGTSAALLSLLIPGPKSEFLPTGAFWASFAAWFGGGTAADTESKKRSHFLRWSWLFALVWLLTLFGIIWGHAILK
jgi:hypothetical protein